MSAHDKVPFFRVLKEFLETVYEHPGKLLYQLTLSSWVGSISLLTQTACLTTGPEVFQRFAELIANYTKKHGSPPEYIARSPGARSHFLCMSPSALPPMAC